MALSRANCTAGYYNLYRLDYQPLVGKMSPHSSSSGMIKDRTGEMAEIEPKSIHMYYFTSSDVGRGIERFYIRETDPLLKRGAIAL